MRQLWLCLLIIPLASASWSDTVADQRIGYSTHYEDSVPQYTWIDAGAQGWYENVDIVEASIEETPADLVFTIKTSSNDVEQPPTATAGSPSFEEFVHGFRFDFGGQTHVVIFTESFFDEGMVVAVGWEVDIFGSSVFLPFGQRSLATEVEGGGWTGSLPKSAFRDIDLVPLREGDVLENIQVFAQDNEWFSPGAVFACPDVHQQQAQAGIMPCNWTVTDAMEDVGTVPITITPPGVGHIFLRMESPFRLSNGLATTYLFEADLRNLEDVQDKVVLQVSDVPSGWEVRLPSAADFSGEGQQTIPIAVTVPFSHVHGVDHIMTLSAISQANASAIVEQSFGIFVADPPQPAGHHDTLSFFGEDRCGGSFRCTRAYMHAGTEPLEGFGQAMPVDEVEGRTVHYDVLDPAEADGPAGMRWQIYLEPGLGMGLDFDISEQGILSADLRFGDDWDARIDAELGLYTWTEDGLWFERLAGGSIEEAFSADQAKTIEVPLTVEPTADLVPYESGRGLTLFINATDTSGMPRYARADPAWFLPDDSYMRLPLLDYHEEVDLTGLDFAELTLARKDSTYKLVNPGKTTIFTFVVGNEGAKAATLDWELDVRDDQADWMQLTPASSTVPAGGNATVAIRVTVPPSAEEGDTVEILLVGVQRGTEVPLYGRMTAVVTDEIEVDDEAEAAVEAEAEAIAGQAGEKSPMPWWVAVVGLALLARRR